MSIALHYKLKKKSHFIFTVPKDKPDYNNHFQYNVLSRKKNISKSV